VTLNWKKIGNEEDEGGDKEKVEVQPKRKTSNKDGSNGDGGEKMMGVINFNCQLNYY